MKKLIGLNPSIGTSLLAAMLITSMSAVVARATPYATSLTNNGTTLSFRLNESASSVKVTYTNLSGTTLITNLGPKSAGLTVTNLSIPGSYSIEVAKTNSPGWRDGAALQISSDTSTNLADASTNTLRFPNPRGVAVNTDPASPYFGRIYVGNAIAAATAAPVRTVGDGIYVLNADYTDALRQTNTARTAGITTFGNPVDDGNSPWRLEIGQDGNLYIADFSTNTGTIYVTDPNVTTSTNVLAYFGNTNSPQNHGRIGSSVIAKGSLASSNLKLYALEGDVGSVNRLRRWDVDAGPLPVDLLTTNLNNAALLEIKGVVVDMDMGPDGKIYLMQFRADGNEGGIFVIDPTVDNSTDGYFDLLGADGLWDVVYDSRADSVGFYAETVDLLRTAQGIKVSPDGNFLAIVRNSSDSWIVPLVNGLPNLAGRRLVPTGSVGSGRDVCFDAAGNLYVSTSGHAALRVFSPGFNTVATTVSTGTFSVQNFVPDVFVDITATDNTAAEPGTPSGDTGTFTFTRSGVATDPLTIYYTMSGTAARGLDWVTNGISATNSASVTFAPGDSSTNVTIVVNDDPLQEPAETVIFTVQANTNYFRGNNTAATVTINDDSDLPAVSVASRGLGSYELLPGRPAKFTLSTLTPVTSGDLTVNFTLSGTAVAGVDYTMPPLFGVITNNTTNVIVTVAPIDNSIIGTNKTLILTVSSDSAYVLGATISATNLIRNDDLYPTTTLYTDNFDTDTTGSWTVKMSNAANDATFNYDYSADGVPSAPNSTGSSTRGLRLRAHTSGAVASGLSVSPTGKTFGDYRLRFDLWMNYNGPMPAGGTGSSEYFTTGIGVTETRTNVTGGIAGVGPGSSVVFSVDGDGGFAEATGDYIAYTNGTAIAVTNIYPAGARDNFSAYYAEFGELPAPAAQLTGFPNQTGLSQIGSLASAWHDVVITKRGTNYTWDIDGLRIANLSYPTALIGNNFSLGYQDINTSLTDNIRMNMAIVDNLRVELADLQAPVITATALINGGVDVQIDFTGHPLDLPASFTLRSASTVDGVYTDVAATITSTGSGTFRAVRAAAGAQQFYRIKR